MGMLAKAFNVDRIAIWKNYTQDDKLYYSQAFEWQGAELLDEDDKHIYYSVKEPRCYSEKLPNWQEILSKGSCINCFAENMPQPELSHFARQGILSVFLAPVFMQERFWGFVSYDSYRSDRMIAEKEQSILRSGGLLITNALQRNEAAIKLEAALNVAQKANDAKSDFLANMSHEMRTPLNAIIGLSDLTLENEGLSEESYANIEKISTAGQTLLATVNDILDISKIEAGKFELIQTEYDVPSLINDTITQNTLRIGDKPIEFILDISADLPARLYGEELRVMKIFNNLLSNACKYTKEGYVKFAVNCVRNSDDIWMTAVVTDSGIGIKHEDIDKLFAAYNQVNTMANRNIEGTGLGLQITSKMVEMMDGSLTVESEYGKGSVFTVKLRQKFVTDARIGSKVVKNLKSFQYYDEKRRDNFKRVRVQLPYARVLAVDDNSTNLLVAKGMMKPYGMRVDCLTSGRQAIDAIREEKVKYNAIFMDHMMPDMDGIEATRHIREIGTDYACNLPIIACTANVIVGNEEMFLSKGFQAFLSKPIDINRLDAIIHHLIRDKEKEESLTGRKISANGQVSAGERRSKERRSKSNRRTSLDLRNLGGSLHGLDIERGLQLFGGDQETYLGILRTYTINTKPVLEAARKVNEGNLADYAIKIHGFKGSSRGICAEEVGAKAEALEHAAKAGDLDFVRDNNPELLETANKLISDLEAMLDKMDAQHPKRKKNKPDQAVLTKLLDACKNYDMDGADAALAEIERYKYEKDNGLAGWLRENVKLMNFQQVIEKLSSSDL
jgi:signal transduction histidine kinase/DNA-binding response OmpR family regulator/HPt (histidine-containing phosphotransfer) domain-containing protein